MRRRKIQPVEAIHVEHGREQLRQTDDPATASIEPRGR
jgi:hypothetical protein